MNPEITNLMMQGHLQASAEAWIEACARIPEPITLVVTPNGYVYSDGIPRPDMEIDYSGPCAMTSDGQPCVIITLESRGKYVPTEWDEASVNDARQALFEELSERNKRLRPARYAITELEMRIYPNSPREMWEALAAAKTALASGTKFEVNCALDNLRAAVNPEPSTEIVQVPLSPGEQAIEDEITAELSLEKQILKDCLAKSD